MTLALGITILGFVFAVMLQVAAFAYFHGRQSHRIDTIEIALKERATIEAVSTVKNDVGRLVALFEKFMGDMETRFERVRDTDSRDDAKIMKAVEHLEARMETAWVWLGERLEYLGAHIDEHAHYLRKVEKGTGISNDRIQAVVATGVGDTGKHRAIVPPPRHTPVPRRKNDPRSED